MTQLSPHHRILSIDIGGTRIKATVLNPEGEMSFDYQKIETPSSGEPDDVVLAIKSLVKEFPDYHMISVGFPGFVRKGIVNTAPNLGNKKWRGIPLAQVLANELGKPVRLVNDADMQGLGVIGGNGLELVVTLGTGFGTSLFMDGDLLPNLELAHHPIADDKTYDQYIGDEAYKKIGEASWNKRLKEIVKILMKVFNYDHLYLGGGNSKKITFSLADNVTLVSNREGIRGGSKLWKLPEGGGLVTIYPKA